MAPYGSPWPNIFLKLSQLKNVREENIWTVERNRQRLVKKLRNKNNGHPRVDLTWQQKSLYKIETTSNVYSP